MTEPELRKLVEAALPQSVERAFATFYILERLNEAEWLIKHAEGSDCSDQAIWTERRDAWLKGEK